MAPATEEDANLASHAEKRDVNDREDAAQAVVESMSRRRHEDAVRTTSAEARARYSALLDRLGPSPRETTV